MCGSGGGVVVEIEEEGAGELSGGVGWGSSSLSESDGASPASPLVWFGSLIMRIWDTLFDSGDAPSVS
jgi:hypothetical protein